MQSLDEKTWAQLSAFGDDAPLCIKTTDSSIDGVRLIDDDEKSVPYVTRSDSNNGLARFVSPKNYEFGSDDGGCITVGLDTQTAFYQPHKFVTGQNIQVITGESLNEDVAQFMVPILRQQMTAKFNWGGNGATLSRMKRLTVMLPVTDSGEPDYAYMAEYAQQKRVTRCLLNIVPMSKHASRNWVKLLRFLLSTRRSGSQFLFRACLNSLGVVRTIWPCLKMAIPR